MPAGAKPLEHGIIPVIGPPGMGKSYFSVLLIRKYVLQHKRPVYTNVPIILKTMRAYLYMHAKGTKAERRAMSKMIRPFTRQHFQRFADRMTYVDKRAQELMDERPTTELEEQAEFVEHEAREHATQEIDAKDPPRYGGGGANMVPPGSVLILDEIHKWYSSKGYRDEPESILAITSMHRHYMLRIYTLSQRLMNISLTFRSMASDYVFCLNFARLPILGPFKLDFLFNWFLYRWYDQTSVSSEKGVVAPGAKSYQRDMHIPELTNKQVYRCYRSYSHAGKIEDLIDDLDKARTLMIGPEAAAINSKKKQKKKEQQEMLGTKGNPRGVRLWMGRINYTILCGIAFFTLGRCSAEPPTEDQSITEIADIQPLEQATNDEQATNQVQQQQSLFETSTLTAIRATGVNVGRRFVPIGSMYEGHSLLSVNLDTGESAWIGNGGAVHIWPIGGLPQRGILPPELRQGLRDALRANAQAESTGDPEAGDANDTP